MDELPRSVLVAEDNRVLADVLRFNLQRAGFAVTWAEHGGVACARLREQSFSLLITDYQMPEIDGEQLCRTVREELQLTELPIIMCSAKGLELDTERLRQQYNVNRVIYKPFSMREIVTLAESLVTASAVG